VSRARRHAWRNVLFVTAATLLCSTRAHAQKAQPVLPDTNEITKEMIDKGRKLYRGKGGCIACHGMQMEGSSVAPPHRKTSGWRQAQDGALPELLRVISNGVPGTLMVKYPNGISPADAVLLASFIWSVNHRDVAP
jgi:mono/diheme cytochrome c family protein